MIAGFENGEQGGADRGKARGRNADAGALRPLKRHHRLLERSSRWRAMAAVLELAAVCMQVVCRGIEHSGTANDGWVDETLLRLGVAPRGNKRSFDLWRQGVLVVAGAHIPLASFMVFRPSFSVKRLQSGERRPRC